MPTMIQNVLEMTDIADKDYFREEMYYSGGKRKTRLEFDFEKLIPVPEELKREHSLLNEVKIFYYLSDKLSVEESKFERGKFPKKVKYEHCYEELKKRARITSLHDIAEGFTASMSSRKLQSFLEDGEKLANNLEVYGCTDCTEWQYENWGCAWNAASTKVIDNNTISFLTPDCPPDIVVQELSNHLPEYRQKSEGADSLSHTWFPEDFIPGMIINAGRRLYIRIGGKVCTEENAEIHDRVGLYDLYYDYKDESLGAHKQSAFNSLQNDQVFFRLRSDLRDKFTALCKYEKVTLTKAISALAQKTVKEGNIPFDREAAKDEDGKYSGPMTHTSVRIGRMLHREFDAVARKKGTTVNRLVTEYMMICLDAMHILIKEDK